MNRRWIPRSHRRPGAAADYPACPHCGRLVRPERDARGVLRLRPYRAGGLFEKRRRTRAAQVPRDRLGALCRLEPHVVESAPFGILPELLGSPRRRSVIVTDEEDRPVGYVIRDDVERIVADADEATLAEASVTDVMRFGLPLARSDAREESVRPMLSEGRDAPVAIIDRQGRLCGTLRYGDLPRREGVRPS